ncbi:MAG: hypothetical protein WDM76_13335 [Limisphaerales bacterium]
MNRFTPWRIGTTVNAAARAGNYDAAYEHAAKQAEHLLARANRDLTPKLLQIYPAVIWGRSGRMPGSAAGGCGGVI